MLPRSFKAAKCKTSLKIAVSRVKLLKNKGEIQIKHMKKDLAHLLETGQDQAARIRVEHVVREEKTMAAYEIIELYCELIVARFAIIESQKNCPIDLKEAVSSVIFASGRCADVPELQDVRKQFTAKYGKDFVSSVLELRPDCGVSRTIIEKLSAKTPDGATKFKILTAIAREHNVKWEPEASADQVSEPAEDLLDEPSKFVSASKIPVESPNVRFQAPNVQFQAPNVQSQAPVHFKSVNEQFLVPLSQKHDSYSKLSENDVIKSSPSFDTFSSANPSKHTTAMPSNSHPESRASENNIGGRQYRPPMTDNEKGSFNRQNWSMKFKDATSAAQAAAESAEMASLAARAAAELSKRGHEASFYEPRDEGSMGPNGSDPKGGIGENSWKTGNDSSRNFYGMNSREQSQQRDELQQDQARGGAESKYDGLGGITRRSSRSDPNGSDPKGGIGENSWKTGNDSSRNFYGMNSREQSQQRDELQQDQARGGAESKYDGLGGITRRSSRSDSSQPSITSTNDDISVTNYQKTDKFSQKNSSKVDVVPDYQRNDTQPSSPSSFSYSGMIHTDANADSAPTTQNYEAVAFEHCEVDIGQEMTERSTKQPSVSDYPVAVFDESSSESEDQLDLGSDSFRTHGTNSHSSISSNVHPWSPKQQKSKSLQKNSFSEQLFEREIPPVEFSEESAKASVAFQPEDLMPAAFDDSDGLSSESEEEMNNLKIREISEGSSLPRKKDVSIRSSFAARTSPELSKASPRKIDEAEGMKNNNFFYSSSDDSGSDVRHLPRKKDVSIRSSFAARTSPELSKASPRKIDEDEGMKNSTFFFSSSDDSGSDVRHLPNVSSPKPLADKEVKTEDSLRGPPSPDGNNDLEFSNHSYNVNEPELNFGRLTGGLRNKGFTRPPYVKHPSRQETVDETQTITERTPVSVSKKTSPSYKAHDMESSNQKQFIKANKGSNSRSQFTYFDSDSDDAEVKPRKTVVTKSDRSGFSLRTRNSPPSEMDSPSRFASEYGPPIRSDSGDGSKASQLGWSSKPQIETEISTNRNNSKSSKSRSSVSQPSEPLPQTDIMSLKVEESSKPLQQTAKRGSTESPKSRSLSEESKLRESSRKSASHFPKTANPGSSESPKSGSLSGGSTLRDNYLRSVSHLPKYAERLRESSLKSADDMPKTAEPLRESSLKSAGHLPKTAERLRESSLRSVDDMPKTAEPLRESSLKSAGHLPKTAERLREKSSLRSADDMPKTAEPLRESSLKSAGHLPKTAERLRESSLRSADDMPKTAEPLRESSLKSAGHLPKTAERLRESSVKSAGHLPKTTEPGSSESPKSPNLSVRSTSSESSLNSASHVHPKLPDYDSFAAHFESLRTNRR